MTDTEKTAALRKAYDDARQVAAAVLDEAHGKARQAGRDAVLADIHVIYADDPATDKLVSFLVTSGTAERYPIESLEVAQFLPATRTALADRFGSQWGVQFSELLDQAVTAGVLEDDRVSQD
jgi:hypothetical protein